MSYDDRVPPQDHAAEASVLGSMMMTRDAIDAVVEVMDARDHYRPAHETIHEAIVEMYVAGEAVDQVTVAAELQRRGVLGKVGSAVYLHELVAHTPIAANAAHYAQIVHDHAIRRRMIDAGTKIVQRGYSGEGEAKELVAEAEAALMSVTGESTHDDYKAVTEIVSATLDEIERMGEHGDEMPGIPTGFYDLDEITGGWRGGQMVVVAGRPSMGKSTVAVDFARAAAIRHKITTAVFSLEMTSEEIVMRLLSAESKVSLNKIRSGQLNEDDWQRVAANLNDIQTSRLYLDDSPNLTMPEIVAKCRRMVQQHGLRLVVIDYLQLMTSGKRVENRQAEVSEFSRQIKLIAKELGVCVVALSQLNRGPEQRTNKRPLMSDLRESGAIEQDADIIILLHREDAYETESTRPGEADLIVAKNRNGVTRDVVVAAQLHYARFVDMAQFG